MPADRPDPATPRSLDGDPRAPDDVSDEALRKALAWIEGLKTSANYICAHCKEPFPDAEMVGHMRTCEKSPLRAALDALREARDALAGQTHTYQADGSGRHVCNECGKFANPDGCTDESGCVIGRALASVRRALDVARDGATGTERDGNG